MFLPRNVAVYAVGTIKYLPALSMNDKIGVVKIVLRWSHSVWRLLVWDFLFFSILYASLALLYKLHLKNDPHSQRLFQDLVLYMEKITGNVPLSFLLGFFVSTILNRWWTIISSVPWMTKPAFAVMSFLHPPAEAVHPDITLRLQRKQMRSIRLTIMRYMNLAWILQIVQLSRQVKERFEVRENKPVCMCFTHTRDKDHEVASGAGAVGEAGDNDSGNNSSSIHFIGFPTGKSKARCDHESNFGGSVKDASARPPTCIRRRMDVINRDPIVKKFFAPLITPEEIRVFERMEKEFHESKDEVFYPSAWIPLQWAVRLLNNALELKFIRNDRHFSYLCKIIEQFRSGLGSLSMYNAFNMPLGYTQVVIFAVYSYFLCETISQQFIGGVQIVNGTTSNTMVTIEQRRFAFDGYVPVVSIFKFIFYLGWFKMGLALLNPLSGDGKGEFPMNDILDYNLQVSTLCAPADNAFFPSYLDQHDNSTAKDQISCLHKLSKIKYDLENAGEEPGEYEMTGVLPPLLEDLEQQSMGSTKFIH